MTAVSVEEMKRSIGGPNVDLCPTCFELITESINELIEAILNGGVLGGCGTVCGVLQNEIEATVCNLLCDYVGIEAFADALNMTDPDPIYVCQVIDFCPEVKNGSVTISDGNVDPAKGPQGTTFNLILEYTVKVATGPGYLVVNVNCPDGQPVGDGQFIEGQPPGKYQITWQLQAQPSEQESYQAGVYQVEMAVCEGDCTTSHPFGGVYASTSTSFSITQ
jgi:hypothetical protein